MKHETMVKLSFLVFILVFIVILVLLQQDCDNFQQVIERQQQLHENMVRDCMDDGKREYECRKLLE